MRWVLTPATLVILAAFAIQPAPAPAPTTAQQDASCLVTVSMIDLTGGTTPFLKFNHGQGDEWSWIAEVNGKTIRSMGSIAGSTFDFSFASSLELLLEARVSERDYSWSDEAVNRVRLVLSCSEGFNSTLVRLRVFVPDRISSEETNYDRWACWEFAYLILAVDELREEIEQGDPVVPHNIEIRVDGRC